MAGFTTAFPTSAKGEYPRAIHNFTITTGNVFKLALGKGSATLVGTYGAATTNYSNLTANSDELPNGSGYTTGGFAWTAAQNITPLTSGTGAYWQWSVDPSWTGFTGVTSGVVGYNSSASNAAVYVGSLGGDQSVTAGTLTLVQPVNGVGTSLLQLN
jgi:hypothetical protein